MYIPLVGRVPFLLSHNIRVSSCRGGILQSNRVQNLRFVVIYLLNMRQFETAGAHEPANLEVAVTLCQVVSAASTVRVLPIVLAMVNGRTLVIGSECWWRRCVADRFGRCQGGWISIGWSGGGGGGRASAGKCMSKRVAELLPEGD